MNRIKHLMKVGVAALTITAGLSGVAHAQNTTRIELETCALSGVNPGILAAASNGSLVYGPRPSLSDTATCTVNSPVAGDAVLRVGYASSGFLTRSVWINGVPRAVAWPATGARVFKSLDLPVTLVAGANSVKFDISYISFDYIDVIGPAAPVVVTSPPTIATTSIVPLTTPPAPGQTTTIPAPGQTTTTAAVVQPVTPQPAARKPSRVELESCLLSTGVGPRALATASNGAVVYGSKPSVTDTATCSLTAPAAASATLRVRYTTATAFKRYVWTNGVAQIVDWVATGSNVYKTIDVTVALSAGVNQIRFDLSYVTFDYFDDLGSGTVVLPPGGGTDVAPPPTQATIAPTVATTAAPAATTTTTTTTTPPVPAILPSGKVPPATPGITVDVKSTGATGNGVTDDTVAIQNAVNKVAAAGGGTVFFSPGVYVVTTVRLRVGITYTGPGATIKRRDYLGKDIRNFTTQGYDWGSSVDSPPLVIRDLSFDGNSANQGAYRGHEQEQSHLIFLHAYAGGAGRLKAYVYNVKVRNSVADGISLYTNVDAQITNVTASDIFRGAVVSTGGYSKIAIDNLQSTGVIDRVGFDSEVDGTGYGGSFKTEISIKNSIIDGGMDIGTMKDSVIDIDNLYLKRGSLYIYNMGSTTTIRNSTLEIGMADSFRNKIVAPGNLTFQNVRFIMVPEGSGYQYGLDIYWQQVPSPIPNVVSCLTCSFSVAPGLRTGAPVYGFFHRLKRPQDTFNTSNMVFGPGFTNGGIGSV